MRTIFTFLLLLTVSLLSAQTPPEFSDLSSRQYTLFNSARVGDYLYYSVPGEEGANWVFKVDQDGNVLDSLSMLYDGLVRRGVVLESEGRLFFAGRLFVLFDGTNALDVWLSQGKIVLELSTDLEVLSEEFFNVVPLGAGVTLINATTATAVMLPEAHYIHNDTLWSIMPYQIYDIDNNMPMGNQYWFDKVGLDGSLYHSFELETVGSYFSTVFTENSMYVYGDVGSEVIGGGILNTGPIGQFDLNGALNNILNYGDSWTGAFGQGSLGQYHAGRIFNAYVYDFSTNEGCPEKSVMLDIRTPDFDLIQRFKLPDCDLSVSGRKPFAFTQDGFTYFTARNFNGSVFLYKLDADFNLVWGKEYDLPQHLPISLNLTDDDGLVLECIESFNTLRLYKVTGEGDIISSVKFPQLLDEGRYFYPNPFRGEVTLAGPLPEGRTQLFATDISGKTFGPLAFNGNTANLSNLPAGQYVLNLRDNSGRIMFSQLAVKVE